VTLFGTHLDGMAIGSIGMLLVALAGFAMNYRGQRGYARWFKQWEAERKARRDAELALGLILTPAFASFLGRLPTPGVAACRSAACPTIRP
jgi:hypothetical protein